MYRTNMSGKNRFVAQRNSGVIAFRTKLPQRLYGWGGVVQTMASVHNSIINSIIGSMINAMIDSVTYAMIDSMIYY